MCFPTPEANEIEQGLLSNKVIENVNARRKLWKAVNRVESWETLIKMLQCNFPKLNIKGELSILNALDRLNKLEHPELALQDKTDDVKRD